MDFSVNITHLYPDLLNLYGDKGNIECLKKRLMWRGIEANVTCITEGDVAGFENADIIFLGGGSPRDMEKVCTLLENKRDELLEYIENGGVFLAFCGGYLLLGVCEKESDEESFGLNLLNIITKPQKNGKRFIGDVILYSEELGNIVGFENNNGKTETGDYAPLGKVLTGFGNDGESGFEGIIYKNVIGTNLHGPLLPKNPRLCDEILLRALKRKYDDFNELSSLDDSLENSANEYVVKTFGKSDTK